jgi:hypothetical protein
MVSTDNTPPRIVPQAPKVFQNNLQSLVSEIRGVFDEDVPRLNFSDDPGEVIPKS